MAGEEELDGSGWVGGGRRRVVGQEGQMVEGGGGRRGWQGARWGRDSGGKEVQMARREGMEGCKRARGQDGSC